MVAIEKLNLKIDLFTTSNNTINFAVIQVKYICQNKLWSILYCVKEFP